MKRILFSILALLILCNGQIVRADLSPLEITEEDLSPLNTPYRVRFPNGSVTDNADGTMSVASGGSIGAPITGADPYRLLWSDASSLLSDEQPEHRASAAEQHGMLINGDATPYTGTNVNPTGIQLLRTIGNLSEATEGAFYYAGINNVITDDNVLSGTVVDNTYNTTNFYANQVGTHTDTVNWSDGSIGRTLYFGSLSPTVTVTGTGYPGFFYGSDLIVGPTVTYNNAGGTYTLTLVGQNILIAPVINLTAGTLTFNAYGAYIAVQGSSAPGTASGYGLYISTVNNFDNNWSIYSSDDVTSYHRGQFWVNELSGTGMFEVESDLATVKAEIVRAAASQSVNISEWQNSSLTQLMAVTSAGALQIGPTTGVNLSAASGVLTVAAVGGANNENLLFDFQGSSNAVQITTGTGVTVISTAVGIRHLDDVQATFGSGSGGDARAEWDTAETNDALKIGINVGSAAQSGNIHIIEAGDFGTNFTHAVSSDPRLYIQSADATQVEDWISLYHDQANGVLDVGNGVLSIPTSTLFGSDIEIDGALNHDGTTVGFYGVTPVVRSSAYTPTNVTTDRSYNADSTTVNELADVVGTLIADIQLTGLLG